VGGDFIIAFTAAVGSLLTALVGLLRYMHERVPRERAPEPPPVDPTEPAGQRGGQPSDAGGGSVAEQPNPPAPQGWSGAVRVAASTPPLPAATRTGRAWWERQAVAPSNDWQGEARQHVRPSAGAPVGQAPAGATPWWRNDELGRPPEGSRERSST
jgi:hypothetical protein